MLKPHFAEAFCNLIHTLVFVCDWSNRDNDFARLSQVRKSSLIGTEWDKVQIWTTSSLSIFFFHSLSIPLSLSLSLPQFLPLFLSLSPFTSLCHSLCSISLLAFWKFLSWLIGLCAPLHLHLFIPRPYYRCRSQRRNCWATSLPLFLLSSRFTLLSTLSPSGKCWRFPVSTLQKHVWM